MYFPVPVEATAFLAAVSAFAVFLLVIFIYVNKKWSILNVGIGGANGSSSKSGRSQGSQQAALLPSAQSTDTQNDKLDGTLQFTSPLTNPPGTCYFLSSPNFPKQSICPFCLYTTKKISAQLSQCPLLINIRLRSVFRSKLHV